MEVVTTDSDGDDSCNDLSSKSLLEAKDQMKKNPSMKMIGAVKMLGAANHLKVLAATKVANLANSQTEVQGETVKLTLHIGIGVGQVVIFQVRVRLYTDFKTPSLRSEFGEVFPRK